MASQAENSSQHLAAARELLNDLEGVTKTPAGDPQTKAAAAVAHSILVLAEQVAVARVLMAGDALAKRANGQTEGQAGAETQVRPPAQQPQA